MNLFLCLSSEQGTSETTFQDVVIDVDNINFDDNVDDGEANCINVGNVLEYVSPGKVDDALTYIMKKIKLGGIAKFAFADLKQVCINFIYNNDLDQTNISLYGQLNDKQFKRNCLTMEQFKKVITHLGHKIKYSVVDNTNCYVEVERKK